MQTIKYLFKVAKMIYTYKTKFTSYLRFICTSKCIVSLQFCLLTTICDFLIYNICVLKKFIIKYLSYLILFLLSLIS